MHQIRNCAWCDVADSFGVRSEEHPETEADPSLVRVSPFVSMARGVAVASLVTRAVTRT